MKTISELEKELNDLLSNTESIVQEIVTRMCNGEKSAILEMSKTSSALTLMLVDINPSFMDTLIEKDYLDKVIQKWIIKTGNFEWIEKLVSKDCFDTGLHKMVVELGNIDIIQKLLKRKDLNKEVQVDIFEIGNEQLNNLLVKRKDLTAEMQVMFAKTHDNDIIEILLEHKVLCKEAQKVIFNTNNHNFQKELLERDDLHRSLHLSFAKNSSGDKDFMNTLLEKANLTHDAQREIAKRSNPEYLNRLIDRDDLDETAEYWIASSKKEDVIENLLNNRTYLRERALYYLYIHYKDKYKDILKDKFGYFAT